VSALRSQLGASYALIAALPCSKFTTVVSVPLYCEYQDVLSRPGMVPSQITAADKLALCRYIASVSLRKDIHFLWRPMLPDPKDDMVLEVAVASQTRYIVTHNLKDFGPATNYGIEAIAPGPFIRKIGGVR
jgi:predicted nucleic acid-binding protein